jgi:nucleoside-diphosphate-sugar epimerase
MILVTGATGLVGSHLVLHLIKQDQTVKALYRTENSKKKVLQVFQENNSIYLYDKIEWCNANILDVFALKNAFEGVTKVFHCAAIVSFDPNDENEIRKTNIEGTANVVNFCISTAVKKLVFVSSIAALGDPSSKKDIVTENTEWDSEKYHSDYAISKYGAEMEVWRAQQEDISVLIVNPGVILPPLFWKEGSGHIYKKVKNGNPFYTNGNTAFITVNDTVKILYILMESNIVNEKYILITENLSYKKFLEIVATAFQTKKPSVYLKPTYTTIGYKIDWILNAFFGKKRMLSKSIAIALHSKNIFSNHKIKEAIPFEFEKIETYIQRIST